MGKEIVWTRRANTKFSRIVNYLDAKWGPRVTSHFIHETFEILEVLAAHPELGSLEHKEKNIRGILLTKHNRIFYRITDSQIIVLNIFDTRSGPARSKF